MIMLRSAAYMVYFYGLTTLFALVSLPGRLLSPLLPAGWPGGLVRCWARAMLGGARVICGISYQVTGAEHLPPGPVVIASMHQSAFDTIVWLLLRPDPAYVLKIELTRIPLFGAMCRLTGMIAVDRQAGASAIRALVRGADAALAAGRSVVIFPEGTRVAPGRVVPLQPGIAAVAARGAAPVVPVLTDSGLRWGRRAFRKNPGTIHIAIQPPIPPGLPRAALMARLTGLYAEAARQAVDNSVGSVPAGFRPAAKMDA